MRKKGARRTWWSPGGTGGARVALWGAREAGFTFHRDRPLVGRCSLFFCGDRLAVLPLLKVKRCEKVRSFFILHDLGRGDLQVQPPKQKPDGKLEEKPTGGGEDR